MHSVSMNQRVDDRQREPYVFMVRMLGETCAATMRRPAAQVLVDAKDRSHTHFYGQFRVHYRDHKDDCQYQCRNMGQRSPMSRYWLPLSGRITQEAIQATEWWQARIDWLCTHVMNIKQNCYSRLWPGGNTRQDPITLGKISEKMGRGGIIFKEKGRLAAYFKFIRAHEGD